MIFQAPSLPMMGLLVALGLLWAAPLKPLRGQDETEGRTLAPEQAADLYRWAQARLQELDGMAVAGELPRERKMERLRALYFMSVKEKDRVKEAETLLEELRNTVPEEADEAVALEALGGALEVVQAKHARWPPNKLKHLRKGMETLDRLVEDQPEQLEVRYLRLVSCYYLPFFLKREESVAQDMAILVLHLPDRPEAFTPPVYRGVVAFLLQNGEMSPEDRARLAETVS